MRRVFLSLILLAAACSEQQQVVELQFVATFDGEPASCTESGPAISDLRLYVSDVFFDATGESPKSPAGVAATIHDSDVWQSHGVALIDLENGQGTCANGTAETNDTVSLTLPAGDYRGLSLTIGVPFELNHANPLTADAPLNDSAMHWHWRSGYKFMRAGVTSEEGATWIHLGSTGCQGTVGNITGCNAPNRVQVQLSNFDPDNDRIAVDLSALLNASAMLESGGKLDCSSGPAETSCAHSFSALGIPFLDTEAPHSQRVFSILK